MAGRSDQSSLIVEGSSNVLTAMVHHLITATCFEAAATAALKAMLGVAEESWNDRVAAAPGRLLRGMVHLRPEGGYQRLYG